MSLHDRISCLRCRVKDGEIGPDFMKDAYRDGFLDAKHKAAHIAKEADARIAELETMAKVFRGCIETGQFPEQGSRLHKMIYELVGENNGGSEA